MAPIDGVLKSVFGDREFSFIHEAIPSDDLSASPRLRDVLKTGLSEQFRSLRVDPEGDWRQFGGESIYPKMGWALSKIQGDIEEGGDFEDLHSPYWGARALEMLRLAWSHALDLADDESLGAGESRLARAHQKLRGASAAVASFMGTFPSAAELGTLGQRLLAWRDRLEADAFEGVFLPALKAFIENFLVVMQARLGADGALDDEAKNEVIGQPDRESAFLRWRDWSIAAAAVQAQAPERGVQFLSVGASHARWLQQRSLIPGASYHYFTGGPLDHGTRLASLLEGSGLSGAETVRARDVLEQLYEAFAA
ncbi:hypothetical protein KIH74_35645, partial [Kineosporia sp. J2-2]